MLAIGLSGAGIAADATAPIEGGFQDGVFRYTFAAPEADTEEKRSCVGVFLTPRWAMTAAHCVRGYESVFTVHCTGVNGSIVDERLAIFGQWQHATHDVTLIEFSGSTSCSVMPFDIASEAQVGRPYFAIAAPAAINSVAGAKPGATEPLRAVVHKEHTIHMAFNDVCLQSGDSGTPLMASRGKKATVLAGILIAGSKACPGEDIFVRLDGVREWIVDLLAQESHRQ